MKERLKRYEGKKVIVAYTIYGREWRDGTLRDIKGKSYGRLKRADENGIEIDDFMGGVKLPFSGKVRREDGSEENVKIERIHLVPDFFTEKMIYGRNHICEHLEATKDPCYGCCDVSVGKTELPCDLEDDDHPRIKYICKLNGKLCKGHIEGTYHDNHGPDFPTGRYDHKLAMACDSFALKDPEKKDDEVME